MKVYTLVINWKDELGGGLISTYSYTTLEKAVESAVEILKECVVDNGKALFDGNQKVNLEGVKELLLLNRWYENERVEKRDVEGPGYQKVIGPVEAFWIRIDENELE